MSKCVENAFKKYFRIDGKDKFHVQADDVDDDIEDLPDGEFKTQLAKLVNGPGTQLFQSIFSTSSDQTKEERSVIYTFILQFISPLALFAGRVH